MTSDGADFTIETPGLDRTAIIRRDAPAPPVPVSGTPRNLRWDDEAFYFITGSSIVRLPRTGQGPPTVIASADLLGELAIVGSQLVWAEQSTAGMTGPVPGRAGRIMAITRPDGTPRVLVPDVRPRTLAVRGDRLYFSDDDAIDRIVIDGSGGGRDRTRLVDATGGTPLLRVGAGGLYFTRAGGVSRVDDAGRVEEIVGQIDIPIGLAVTDDAVIVLANAVINKPYPEYARPAQLVLVRAGQPPQVLWSEPEALVADLEVFRGRARFTRRAVSEMSPSTFEVALPVPQ